MHVLIPVMLLPVQAIWFSRLPPFYAALFACLCIISCGYPARDTWVRLTARLKWIGLSIALLSVWFTPGEYIPGWNVTYEGIWHAAFQLLQLLAMLALVSVILQFYSATQLVSGLYQGLAALRLPARWLQPMVVRLYLVLQVQQPPLKWRARHWQQLFDAPEQLLADVHTNHISVQLTTLCAQEKILLMALLSGALLGVIWP